MASRIAGTLLRPFGYTYETTEDAKQRRRVIATLLRSEDDELLASARGKLVSQARDLPRNYSVAAWAIRKHLDYVASFNFQARSGNTDLDNSIERLMRWWSRKENCDAAGRHPLPRMVRLLEARKLLDGDCFLAKLADGRIQAVEGDRVKDVIGSAAVPEYLAALQPYAPVGSDKPTIVQGIILGDAGNSRAYIVHRRAGGARMVFERIVPAWQMIQHGTFDRFDQVRGITPLSAAMTDFRDCYEAKTYALMKAKVAQLFALVVKREATAAMGQVTQETNADGTATGKLKMDFGAGPIMLDLDPQDDASFLESHIPSSEFQAFMQLSTAAALKSIDIPYSFFDEAHTNYSGARQALLQYEQSAVEKRRDLRDALDNLTAWRLGLWSRDGVLEIPEGMTFADLNWEWIATGIPWIDPLKEVQANTVGVLSAQMSRTEIAKSRGREWREIVDELAAEEEYLREKGIHVDLAQAATIAAAARREEQLDSQGAKT